MYRTGHYGAALLVYAPVLFFLTAQGAAELAALGAIVAIALSVVPDCDERVPLVPHRGPTHTVWFALLVGAAAGAGGFLAASTTALATPAELGGLGGVVGTAAILSHIAADTLTPMGVRPFAPLSARHYTCSLARSGNPIANYGLLALGTAAAAGAVVAGGTTGTAAALLENALGLAA